MNLTNETIEKLWDMLYEVDGRIRGNEIDGRDSTDCEIQNKYKISKEIIRRKNESKSVT